MIAYSIRARFFGIFFLVLFLRSFEQEDLCSVFFFFTDNSSRYFRYRRDYHLMPEIRTL